MFNPNAYRDTDFGLESGESFEPEDADDALPVDTAGPHVMTVLGPIDPDDLGICLTHEHLGWKPTELDLHAPDYRLDHVERVAEELESFALRGGRSIVDATTADVGRNAAALHELARRVPLHIIASTGRHNHIYRDGQGDSPDADGLAVEFIDDLTRGMDGTSALAGMIAVGTGAAEISGVDEAVLVAAARAHLATGVPIAMQPGDTSKVHGILDRLELEGVDPSRVILQQMDRMPTVDAVIGLAARGASCSFDQIGKAGSEEDRARARTIVEVFGAGYGDSVLISQDLDRKSWSRADGGNPGLTYLLEWFTLMLMEAGAEAEMVRRLLIENPRRALCIVPGDRGQEY
jgi:phosphotriesterase-related protein